MKIEFIKEGLDSGFDFVAQAQAIRDAETSAQQHNQSRTKFQKAFDTNSKSPEGEQLKSIADGIEKWDDKGLTKNFRSVLTSRIAQKGWDRNDVFIQWLINTNDNNIKALDAQSATTLIKHLDERHFRPKDNYITDFNELFSESSKDTIYKLNALYMLSNDNIAKKYKNDSGEVPKISLIFKDGKFLPARQMQRNLEDFHSNDNEEDLIPFQKWISDVAKWEPKSIYSNIKKIIDTLYTDAKVNQQWTQQFKFIFSNDGEKERSNLFNYCKINKNIKPTQAKEIWDAIIEYLNDHKDLVKKSTTEKASLSPSTVYTVANAIEALGLTIESSYRKLGSSLNRIADPDKRSSFIKVFKKMWASKRFRRDFFNSKIKTTSKGNLPWATHIQNYILSIPTLTETDEE